MQNDTLELISQTAAGRRRPGPAMRCALVLLAASVFACGGRSGLESVGRSAPGSTASATGGGGNNAQGGAATSHSTNLGGELPQGGVTTTGGAGTHGTRQPPESPCTESMCTSGGWCWLNPLPQGNSLFDAVVHDGEFWAVGEDGLVIRGDGKHWLRCPTPTTESLRGSWFAPDGTLWVVGTGGVVLSFDGRTWTLHHTQEGLFLNDVHGTSSTDIWVVGDAVALHYDGARWERQVLQTKGAAYCVWARGADDVWIGGTEVWHFNGRTWRMITSLPSDARAIWGDEKHSVWFAANDIVQCDRLGCQSTPTLSGAQFDIWGTSSNDIWTIGASGGMHWNGSRWKGIDVPASLTSAAGGTPYGLVVVGHFGRMYQQDGDGWSDLRVAIGSVWTDVWGTADDDIWVSGNSVAHFDGQALALSPAPTNGGLQSVHGTSKDDVWFAGCSGALIHWNRGQWSDYSIKSWSESSCFFAVWVEARDSAWAVGSAGVAFHWDGQSWVQMPSLPEGKDARALSGAGGKVFAADDTGSLAVWQTTGWQFVAWSTVAPINAIWAASGDEIWFAGEEASRAALAHWWKDTMGRERINATKLTDVWGTSSRDVWATGDGRVFHFDGSVIAERPSGVNLSRSRVWVSPTGVRWMVGGNGILRHAP